MYNVQRSQGTFCEVLVFDFRRISQRARESGTLGPLWPQRHTPHRDSRRSRALSLQWTVPETALPIRDAVQHARSIHTLDITLDAVPVSALRIGSGRASSAALFQRVTGPPAFSFQVSREGHRGLARPCDKGRLEDAASVAYSCTEMSSRAPPL